MKKIYMTPNVDTVELSKVRLLNGVSNTPTEVPVDPGDEGNQNNAEARDFDVAFSIWDDDWEEE